MRLSRIAPILIPKAGGYWPSNLTPRIWLDAAETDHGVVSTWTDISGNGLDFPMYNFAGTTSDGWNTNPDFLQCDGTDSYVRFDADDHSLTNLNPASTDCSFVTAIKSDATANGWHYNLSAYSADQCLGLYYYADSPDEYQVNSYDVSGTSKALTLSGVDANAWHIIGVTYSQTTKVTTVYVDGVYFGATAAHATGLMEVTRHSLGVNYYGGARQCSVGFSGIFTGVALTEQNHEDIYNLNCLRFGLSKI